MKLEKYSIGLGDRFGLEGKAQLRALQKAKERGFHITPVWNKSNREHAIIGTSPADTRIEADEAVKACRWEGSYYVDADHIGLATVEKYLDASDFFTIDVADFIGKPAKPESVWAFKKEMTPFKGTLTIPGVSRPFEMTDELLDGFARNYLAAIEEAGRVYRAIADRKGREDFIPEVSLDEAAAPQTPAELFLILAAIAREGVPAQTIAPKFSGAFLKGIDYVGSLEQFEQEFEDDVCVLEFAVNSLDLPPNLKLSVHSGSDKFSIYPAMHRILRKKNTGLHLKTAGTTWLEEVIGLAAAGGRGLECVKDIYYQCMERFDEMCRPYLTVVDIDRSKLPSPEEVKRWGAGEFVAALRHDQSNPRYNVHFRQLIHVSFRIAAEMGSGFRRLLEEHRTAIEENVSANIYERHVVPLFVGSVSASGMENSRAQSLQRDQ